MCLKDCPPNTIGGFFLDGPSYCLYILIDNTLEVDMEDEICHIDELAFAFSEEYQKRIIKDYLTYHLNFYFPASFIDDMSKYSKDDFKGEHWDKAVERLTGFVERPTFTDFQALFTYSSEDEKKISMVCVALIQQIIDNIEGTLDFDFEENLVFNLICTNFQEMKENFTL